MPSEVCKWLHTCGKGSRGHGHGGQAHPGPHRRWDPPPRMCFSAGCPPGRVQPRPPAGSPLGHGGSWEGKNQKQIAGVNGAEPRAASAAAV